MGVLLPPSRAKWGLFRPLEGFLPLIGIGAPSIMAFVLTGLSRGRTGVRELWRGGTRWRVGISWYAIVVLLPCLAYAVSLIADSGLSVPAFGPWAPALVSGLLAGILEEFGWSGFAFPRLQKIYGFVPAGLAMGFIVAFWHLPLFFTPGQPHHEFAFVPFLLTLIVVRFLFGWVYNGSGGSTCWLICIGWTSRPWLAGLAGQSRANHLVGITGPDHSATCCASRSSSTSLSGTRCWPTSRGSCVRAEASLNRSAPTAMDWRLARGSAPAGSPSRRRWRRGSRGGQRWRGHRRRTPAPTRGRPGRATGGRRRTGSTPAAARLRSPLAMSCTASTSRAPWAARALAVSTPRPADTPVTSAVAPVRSTPVEHLVVRRVRSLWATSASRYEAAFRTLTANFDESSYVLRGQ